MVVNKEEEEEDGDGQFSLRGQSAWLAHERVSPFSLSDHFVINNSSSVGRPASRRRRRRRLNCISLLLALRKRKRPDELVQ